MTAPSRVSRATTRFCPSAARQTPALPRDIKVMLAAAFLIALGFGLVAPVLPQFATTFDVGATAAAVIVSIFAFMRLVFAPAGGALIGRLGERPVYVAGLLIVAVSTAACAFAQDYWQLLVFRGLGGVGSVMFTVASMALVVRLAPPESRGRVSGAYASAFLIGSVLRPVVGGLLAGFGLRVPFLATPPRWSLLPRWCRPSSATRRPRTGHDGAAAPDMQLGEALAGQCVPRGAVVQLRQRLGNVRRADGHGAAVCRCCARLRSGGGRLALAVFAAGNAAALTFSGRLADSLGRQADDGRRAPGHRRSPRPPSASRPAWAGSWPRPLLAGVGSGLLGRPSRPPSRMSSAMSGPAGGCWRPTR